MAKYQYQQVQTNYDIGSQKFQAVLDRMGNDGWELISVIPHQKANFDEKDVKFRFTDPVLEAQYQNTREVTYLIFLRRERR